MRVQLGAGGDSFEAAADETILEAAENAGVHLPFGCRTGSCGACRARLLKGEVDYPQPPRALSRTEQAASMVLLCQAQARSDLDLRIAGQADLKGQRLRVLPARVAEKRQLNHDVLELLLMLPKTERLDYRAGQYLDILLPGGARRSFSMANAPRADGKLELHIRRVPGGQFTPRAFDELKRGSLLRFEGPLGSFYLRQESRPAIFVGGGTGFAPLKAMLESEAAAGRGIHVYWGAQTAADLYMHDWMERLATTRAGLHYEPVISGDDPDWGGRRGFVHAAVAEDFPDLSSHVVYMSGPPAMIAAGKEAFFGQGLDTEALYYDAFDYAGG